MLKMTLELKKMCWFFGTAIFVSNVLVYIDFSMESLQASLLGEIPVEAMSYETAQENVVQTDWIPVLVKNAQTYTNRNGYEVFHGYEYNDIEAEKQLQYAQEVRNAREKRASLGIPRQRTTNYRRSEEEYRNSAPLKTAEDQKGESESRVVAPAYKKSRISLRSTERQYGGTAGTFKLAKEKVEAREEWEKEVWAQNREGIEEETESGRKRIVIKVSDSRKELLDYYEQRAEDEKKEIIAPPASVPQDITGSTQSTDTEENITDDTEVSSNTTDTDDKIIIKEIEVIRNKVEEN